MSLEKPPARARRASIAYQEERTWVAFYQRAAHDAALATELLAQLDRDPELKRVHLGLYLCCKQSLRDHKARQLRQQRIAGLVRGLCSGLLLAWPRALLRALRHGGQLVLACLPESRHASTDEPARAQARKLQQTPGFAAVQADFQQQARRTAGPVAVAADASEPAGSATAARTLG